MNELGTTHWPGCGNTGEAKHWGCPKTENRKNTKMKTDHKTALLALIESIREVGASHQYDDEQGVILKTANVARWVLMVVFNVIGEGLVDKVTTRKCHDYKPDCSCNSNLWGYSSVFSF